MYKCLSYSQYREIKVFPTLNGIRAISVLLVILWHMSDKAWMWLSGYTGVLIFFVLSGYLITTLLLREEDSKSVSIAAFYVRRVFRIFPLYYLTLAAYLILVFVLKVYDAKLYIQTCNTLPLYLFYFNEFLPTVAVYSHSWSLGVEEKFYLIWPICMFILLRNRSHTRIYLTLFAVLLCSLFFDLYLTPSLNVHHLTSILLGCLLAFLLHDAGTYNICSRLIGPTSSLMVTMVFISVQLLLPYHKMVSLFYPYIVTIYIALAVISTSNAFNFLRHKALVFIGERSYAIYLFHVICINIAERVFPVHSGSIVTSFSAAFLSTVLSIAAAAIAYRAIEKPLIIMGKTFSRSITSKTISINRAIKVPATTLLKDE
ncbi:acyltransferase family protein [Geotalea uraniireducens]|uniref:Acyltransferase 3 n=1 Tax=Geotalea uraniireducens (strain Rf4) TaxID=351605 RepID=A5GBY2_GEOUR|nr:acyltransferase [Geotalea uraniireducens]ABQ24909.1 acyltransferase 3 [Geotalea uraniireducens Rf4]